MKSTGSKTPEANALSIADGSSASRRSKMRLPTSVVDIRRLFSKGKDAFSCEVIGDQFVQITCDAFGDNFCCVQTRQK